MEHVVSFKHHPDLPPTSRHGGGGPGVGGFEGGAALAALSGAWGGGAALREASAVAALELGPQRAERRRLRELKEPDYGGVWDSRE